MRSDTFSEINRLRGRMRSLMDSSFTGQPGSAARAHPWVPPADIHACEGRIVIGLEVPGFGDDELEVTLEGAALTISGSPKAPEAGEACLHRERGGGAFSRSFTLAWEPATHQAHLADGVLTVTLQRTEAP